MSASDEARNGKRNGDDLPAGQTKYEESVVAFDEALGSGTDVPNETSAETALDTKGRERLEAAKECLRLIERVRGFKQHETRSLPAVGEHLPQQSAYRAGGALHRIGRFEIVRELGRGSHGIVFLARDPALNREIALKVPRPEAILTPQLRERFLREGKSAARLNHPNILPVHEAGEAGPICYLVQSYCSGPSLAGWLASQENPVPSELAARIVAELADGVQHAHQQGILHRDIKPANVMLEIGGRAEGGARSEKELSPFTPRLTDFGLAKALDDDPNATATLGAVGTVTYMPPEQAAGQSCLVGPRSDVYSLGALLYELLTRRPPIAGANQLESLRLIATEEPKSIRELRPDVPRQLEAVCLKCLEKSPQQRYVTAGDLAADLRRFLNGEAVTASPQGRLWSLLRRFRRQSAVRVAGGVAMLLLAGGLALCLMIISSNRRDSRGQALPPVDREAEYLTGLGGVAQGYLNSIANRGDTRAAVQELDAFLERHRPQPGEADYRGFEWHYLWRLCHPEKVAKAFPKLLELVGHQGEVYFVAFSPDGKRIATAGQDHTGRIWDARTGKLLATLSGHTDDVNWITFFPDAADHRVATASDDKTVRVWDCATGKQEAVLLGHKSKVVSVEVATPENRDHDISTFPSVIVSGDHQGQLFVWEWPGGRRLRSIPAHSNRIQAIAPMRGHDFWITASADQTAKEWNAITWTAIRPHVFDTGISGVSCNSEGTLAAFSTSVRAQEVDAQSDPTGNVLESRLILDDLQNGNHWITLLGPPRLGYESVRFYPGRCALVAVSRARARAGEATHDVVLWDVPTQRWWDVVDPNSSASWCAAFSPNGTRLATAGLDGIVRVWDSSALPAGTRLPSLDRDPEPPVGSLRYSPDGRKLLVTHVRLRPIRRADSYVVWDVTGERPKPLYKEQTPETDLGSSAASFSRDGRFLAASDTILSGTRLTGTIRVLEADTGREIARSTGYDGIFRSLEFSADGRSVMAATRDEPLGIARLYLWNIDQSAPKLFRESNRNHFLTAVLSPDGKLLATNEERVELFEFPSMRLAATLPTQLGHCGSIAFSPNGKTLAAGGEGGIIHFWDIAGGARIMDLRSDGHAILSLAFSPDGTRLAAGLAGTPRVDLWHLKSGKRLAPFAMPSDSQSVGDLAFSPDQRTLAAAGVGATGCVFLFPLGSVDARRVRASP